MSYHGPADITLAARLIGHPDEAVENPGTIVHLRRVRPGITEVVFSERISAPPSANWLTLTLPNGMSLGGKILQAAPSTTNIGGWITFAANARNLGV